MKRTMIVMLALLFAVSAICLAGGDQNQNQKGKEGTPGEGDQNHDRIRICPDGPECPGCPDCECPEGDGPNGDGSCGQASSGGEVIAMGDRDRIRDGDCEDPDCDGPNGPNGPNDDAGDGNGPNGPNGDGDGEGGDGPFGPGECPE